MSGRGKGPLATKGPKRHQTPSLKTRERMGLTKPSVRRLARRGGVKRLSGDVYPRLRVELKMWTRQLMIDAVTYMQHGKRKTMSALDVVNALRNHGQKLYGFDA